MRHRRFQRGQIMLIILGSLLLGGGAAIGTFASGKSVKSLRKDVQKMQIEETRRNEVLRLFDRWEAVSGPALEDFEAYGQAMLELMRQQQASTDQFRDLMDRQRDSARDAEDRLLPLRDELRATLTRAEWDRLFN
jgi:Spy/CpxP family protein refolding chaperone